MKQLCIFCFPLFNMWITLLGMIIIAILFGTWFIKKLQTSKN